MARLWQSGFELNSLTTNIEVTGTQGTAGSTTIQTGTIRSGSYALQIDSTGGGSRGGGIRKVFVPSDTNGIYYFRGYFNIAQLPNNVVWIMLINTVGGANMCSIRLNTDGTLSLFNESGTPTQIGSSSVALSTGTWHLIELKVDSTTIASSILVARLNGVQFASGTTDLSTNGTGIGTFIVGYNNPSGSITSVKGYIDDLAINDSSGSFQNTYAGDGHIIHSQPNAQGDNNAFTVNVGGSAGATNNYTRVDEVTPDDATSYNGDTVSGDIDDFKIAPTPSVIGISDTINVVMVGVRYRAVVAAGESPFVVRMKKTSHGTVSEGSTITPNTTSWNTNANTTPYSYSLILYQDPDGSNWTKGTLDTAQIGYRITSTGTNATDITTIWLSIDYTSVNTVITKQPVVSTQSQQPIILPRVVMF